MNLEARSHPPSPDEPPRAGAGGLAAQREHSLLALAELGRALDLRLNERELAQLALFNLVGHFGTPRAAMWLKPEAGGALEPAAVVGLASDAARALAGQLAGLPAAWPVGEIVPFTSAHWLGPVAASASEQGLSVLARFEGQDDWLGFVALGTPRQEARYGAIDQELIGASLGIVGAAIENQRLLRSLHRGNQQLAAANERLQELDRLRSEMLQNLNHEFRTPIAIILGAASCLRDMEPGDQGAVEFIDMIEKQSAQVRDMVTLLLDHAELMSHRAALTCEPVDIGTCVREMVSSRAAALAEAGRKVDLGVANVNLLGLADAVRLRRALDELLTNALKFSAPGTPVLIRVERRSQPGGDRIVIDIRDHGRGMTREEIEVAFQAFRQGDGSSTRSVGGLGIGLTAARRILELMQGSITLISESGQGTTARAELRAA